MVASLGYNWPKRARCAGRWCMCVVLPCGGGGGGSGSCGGGGGDNSQPMSSSKYSHPTDEAALFRGDLLTLFLDISLPHAAKRLTVNKGFSIEQAQRAMAQRAILYLFQYLEGWVVQLARWVLQAAATSRQGSGALQPFWGSTMRGMGSAAPSRMRPKQFPKPQPIKQSTDRRSTEHGRGFSCALAHSALSVRGPPWTAAAPAQARCCRR